MHEHRHRWDAKNRSVQSHRTVNTVGQVAAKWTERRRLSLVKTTPTTLILMGDRSCFALGVSCRHVSLGTREKSQIENAFPEKCSTQFVLTTLPRIFGNRACFGRYSSIHLHLSQGMSFFKNFKPPSLIACQGGSKRRELKFMSCNMCFVTLTV